MDYIIFLLLLIAIINKNITYENTYSSPGNITRGYTLFYKVREREFRHIITINKEWKLKILDILKFIKL